MAAMFNPDSFYSVILPTYYVTKVFGLTPFKINNEICEKSLASLAWSIFFMLFINIFAFIGLETGGIDNQIIAEVTDILDTYVGQGGLCFGILFACIFRNDMVAVLQDIKTFDKNVQFSLQIDVKREYRKEKNNAMIFLIAALMLAIPVFSYASYVNLALFNFDRLGEFISYTAPYLLATFVELQFCTLLLSIKRRFNWLNLKTIEVSQKLTFSLGACDNLLLRHGRKNQLTHKTHAVASGFVHDRALYFMEKIRTNHYKLCTLSKTINKVYSVQILFVVLQSFITIVVSLYYSGKYVIIDNEIPISFLIYSGIQFTNAIGQLLTLVITCSATADEAKQTGILINKIISFKGQIENTFKEELQLEITLFSLQLLHHNVEFTACKIFIINESMIFSIVGAVMSYLLIVIQFEVARIKIK